MVLNNLLKQKIQASTLTEQALHQRLLLLFDDNEKDLTEKVKYIVGKTTYWLFLYCYQHNIDSNTVHFWIEKTNKPIAEHLASLKNLLTQKKKKLNAIATECYWLSLAINDTTIGCLLHYLKYKDYE